MDWARTPLGPPEQWPSSLKTTVATLLHSRHPMFLWWGDELVQLYNDAYLPSFGAGKHPAAMGQSGRECWKEIWPLISPQIDAVMQRAEATWNEDQLVPIVRNGGIEEVYWTYGYSPIFLEDGAVGGTLVVCTETTARVVAARRLELMRSLAVALAAGEENTAEVAWIAAAFLAKTGLDVPFSLFLAGDEVRHATGLEEETAAAVHDELRGRTDPAALLTLSTPLRAGPWPEPPTRAYVLPLEEGSREAIVFGVSARLPFDDAYRSFLHHVGEQIVRARGQARLLGERRDLLMQAPVAAALLSGPEHVFEIANPHYRAMVGGRELVGKAYRDAFPELRDTALPAILDGVYLRGEPFVAHEMPVSLVMREGGPLEERFFRFNLEPIRNAGGHVYGMMAIAVDVTEQVSALRVREQADAEREKLLSDAEAASRAKDQFLAMLGHELRNPLAPIVTALQLMKLKGAGALTRERDIIERQAQHLVHLVDDLLDVSRVAQGKIALKRSRVAISSVVARAVEMALPLIESKRHRVDVGVPDTGLDVDADPVRLAQVIANLLTNAARYTEPGGHIAVTATRVGDEVVVRVADNGSGIAEQQLPHLFEAFFQGPRPVDRAEGGLGLGLALVRSLIALHGGTVAAQSEGPGRGSVFELRLPLAATAPATGVPPPPKVAAAEARRGDGVRVLVVDDNEDIAELFATFLQAAGFEVKTAHDGPSALELTQSFRPAVAVLDIGLPVMDGYELATRLREGLGDAAPRMIAMSGYGQYRDRENSHAAGFERHLVKPVDAYALVAAITGER